MNKKAQWHLDFNGGFVPVLETPAGDLIKESGIVQHVALDEGKDNGLQLFPSDPIEAAKLRVELEDLMKMLKTFWPVFMGRGEDTEANETFIKEGLPLWEAYASRHAEDKWLFGTDEPTMLDINLAPFWDMLFTWESAPAVADTIAQINFRENAPRWVAYMEKFRAHPVFAPHVFNTKAVAAHAERSRGWEKGVKCQLSAEVLEGVFEGVELPPLEE